MKLGKRQLAAMVFAGSLALAATVSFSDVPKDAGKDWPQFRGPARDNISKETGLLKQWPAGGPPLAWKVTTLGEGHASVAVANGKIFTSGLIDAQINVVCLNEADGKLLWKTP